MPSPAAVGPNVMRADATALALERNENEAKEEVAAAAAAAGLAEPSKYSTDHPARRKKMPHEGTAAASPPGVIILDDDGVDENEETTKASSSSMLTQMVDDQFDSVSRRRDRSRDRDLELLRKIRITMESHVKRLLLAHHHICGTTLSSNIDALRRHNIVTGRVAAVLHRLRGMGNVAAHNSDGASLPSRTEIEDLFRTYVGEMQALGIR